MKAPFPWFGGKRRVADVVWRAFGDVKSYVEPFAGSLAVLLERPHDPQIETVNDYDGHVANFWRALKHDPDGVAEAADRPVNEVDLHAIHLELLARQDDHVSRMMAEPGYYDAELAGWWVWGISCWIGSGWCSPDANGKPRVRRPHLGPSMGVHRERDILGYMRTLSVRLRRVRVCCGDWSRVCGDSSIGVHWSSACGIFLDPPYDNALRADGCYREDDGSVAAAALEWCREAGKDKRKRIALCGYEGEHDDLEALGWSVYAWKSHGGGYGSRNGENQENSGRERIWFSPACLPVEEDAAQGRLFE